jgi:protein required for attachment to host cells
MAQSRDLIRANAGLLSRLQPCAPAAQREPRRAARIGHFGAIAMTKLPHDALVFIGDGRKALFLRNMGDEQIPDLRTEQVFKEDNPASREQGTDKPGRGFASAGSSRRSGMEETDWHQLEEQRFAERVAAALEDVVRKRHVPAILVAAPPKTLAELRRVFHADVKAKIVAELDKDLTKQPVDQIEAHLCR